MGTHLKNKKINYYHEIIVEKELFNKRGKVQLLAN